MGASTTSAFTDYVTHLIAEEHGGAKYWVRTLPCIYTSRLLNTMLVRGRAKDTHTKTIMDSRHLRYLAAGRRF